MPLLLSKRKVTQEKPEYHAKLNIKNLKRSSSNASCETAASQTSSPKSTVWEDYDNVFRNLYVIKALNLAKCQIYLVKSRVTKKYFAMKIFPFSKGNPHRFFRNEARFSFLDHENVVRIFFAEPERETNTQGVIQKASYIIMEYAPYGDLFDFIVTHTTRIHDNIIRTYFRQLIEGIEYLHNNGVSHMDLKPENLLIGENYMLKIADFDLSFLNGDRDVISKGTESYCSPEVAQEECKNPQAADIYSAGIILFMIWTRGTVPYVAFKGEGKINFEHLMHNNNEEFWQRHCRLKEENKSLFQEEFKELFNSMVKRDPSKRATIKQIKDSRWYNQSYYTKEELRFHVERICLESMHKKL